MKLLKNNFLHQYLFILKGHYGRLAILVAGFMALSVMELLGLGLIGPFVGAVINPEILEKSTYMMIFFNKLKAESGADRILLLGCSVVFIFSIKNYFAYKVQSKVYGFSFKYRTSLVEKLMGVYMAMPFSFYLERNSSSIINTVIGHTKAITDDMLLPSLKLISDAIVLFALSVFLFVVSPVAMMFLLTILLITMFLYISIVKPKIRNYCFCCFFGFVFFLHLSLLCRSRLFDLVFGCYGNCWHENVAIDNRHKRLSSHYKLF